MGHTLLGRGQREAQALKQAHRAEIVALEHGEEAADFVMLDKIRDHRFDSAAPKASTPVSAGQLVGDGRVTSRADCCLNITDELGSWNPDDPVKPLFVAVRRESCLELLVAGAQPFKRWWWLVLVFVDCWVAEDHEHLLRVRRDLWLQRKTSGLDDAHARVTVHDAPARKCLARRAPIAAQTLALAFPAAFAAVIAVTHGVH